jgi:hypothetical protein
MGQFEKRRGQRRYVGARTHHIEFLSELYQYRILLDLVERSVFCVLLLKPGPKQLLLKGRPKRSR